MYSVFELVKMVLDFVIHIDVHLSELIRSYGLWTYLILVLIIFSETGLVVAPLLPGDSLLFAAGAFAARGDFNIFWLFVLLSIAAVLGDTVNYWVGSYVGPKVFHNENVRFLNRKYLDRTHEFYEKYGGKTIIIARFVPIIRTFAPFVAGIGSMTYGKFISYNVIGGILWIGAFAYAGFFFGNIPMVKHNFTLVIFAIIILSVMPGVIEIIKHKMKKA
ncbi:MAG TPA: DedA family protein [Syntrophorhabdaceae bacterium]|nr:DedA family protein [Syntrophorhabdaceae bacterium]